MWRHPVPPDSLIEDSLASSTFRDLLRYPRLLLSHFHSSLTRRNPWVISFWISSNLSSPLFSTESATHKSWIFFSVLPLALSLSTPVYTLATYSSAPGGGLDRGARQGISLVLQLLFAKGSSAKAMLGDSRLGGKWK